MLEHVMLTFDMKQSDLCEHHTPHHTTRPVYMSPSLPFPPQHLLSSPQPSSAQPSRSLIFPSDGSKDGPGGNGGVKKAGAPERSISGLVWSCYTGGGEEGGIVQRGSGRLSCSKSSASGAISVSLLLLLLPPPSQHCLSFRVSLSVESRLDQPGV